MAHISGGKITKSHTTVIELGLQVVKFLISLDEVSKVALGTITFTPKSSANNKKVTISTESGCIKLEVIQKRSRQIIRIFGTNLSSIATALVKYLRENTIEVKIK